MSDEPRNLDVSIMGREFRVSCPADEERMLLESVGYVDRKMRDIRDAGKVIGVERIAIMAALNLAHELLTTRTPDFDVGDLKRRIAALEGQLDQVLAEQDKLF